MFPMTHHPGSVNDSIRDVERYQLLMQQLKVYGTQVGVSDAVYLEAEL
jgi:hypothetical protein